MITNLIKALLSKEKTTEKNPWGGETLEWQIETPPIHENFIDIPIIHEAPYAYKQNETETLKNQEVK
jgi:cytochrome c oxidase subunit 1